MKKNILNEVNKIREMMGLINEQNEQETGCIDGNCVNGTGTYVWRSDDGESGYEYNGQWSEGMKEGRGIYKFYGDSRLGTGVYEGEFVQDKPKGQGKVSWKNGDDSKPYFWSEDEWNKTGESGRIEFVGEMLDGGIFSGTMKYENGDVYTGVFDSYAGEGVEAKEDHEGTMKYANGDEYKGYWVLGVKWGKGILTCADGTKHEQEWEKGKLISGDSCNENSNNNTGSQGDNTFPENWKEGINNKGWVIMKGSHGYEGKIPDTKKAIEFIQTKVGLSGDDVDGLYGSNTAKKVWNYQENNGLKPDGKVGKNTLAKMLS